MLYQKPWMEIQKFEKGDVIVTSYQDPDNPNDSNDTGELWP